MRRGHFHLCFSESVRSIIVLVVLLVNHGEHGRLRKQTHRKNEDKVMKRARRWRMEFGFLHRDESTTVMDFGERHRDEAKVFSRQSKTHLVVKLQ